MLQEMEAELGPIITSATMFCADIGPGSFTGTRVGVILAKTLAFAIDAPVAGATAFDLISPNATVAFPSKRGEYFVRVPGEAPFRTTSLTEHSIQGFGFGNQDRFPNAAHFDVLVNKLERQTAEAFLPEYLIEPSISIPNKPYAPGATS
jgi:tRNA A37 threonylcarbamoyladenosine modification protein TsaB